VCACARSAAYSRFALLPMQIRMLDHLQEWNFHLLKTHERLDKDNAICLSVPADHDLTPNNKSYEELSQSNGKKMKEMSRYLLGVVTQSLRGGNHGQHPIFNRTIECTQAFLEFYMYAQYKSHVDATLRYMEDDRHHFHPIKAVMLLRRAGKKAKAEANTLRTELVKKRKVDKETDAESLTQSKKRCEMNTLREYISHETDNSKELDPDFNFPEIYLMSHWANQISRYRALQQYSTVRHEQAHKTNLKDGCNSSYHNLNYPPQGITSQRRILWLKLRELSLPALPPHRENSAAACKVLPSGADLAAPLSHQSYAKPQFPGPQNCCDGMHPEDMIKDFRPLLNNTLDAMHHAAIYSGSRE